MLHPYLNFAGNARDAFAYYQSLFGGEFESLMTYADAPEGMPVAPEFKDKIMHITLPIGASKLMACDAAPGFAPPLVVGNNIALVAPAKDKADADRLFAGLSKDGTVIMPMEETFWGSYFGQCTDQFGITWMIDHELNPPGNT